MKPKTMVCIMLAGLVPYFLLGLFVASTFWGTTPRAVIFVFGFMWATAYNTLAIELIEWRARRQAKDEK